MERKGRAYWYNVFQGEQPDEITFEVRRENRNKRFFSEGALEDLDDKFLGLIGARLMSYHREHGRPPHTMNVTIKVELSG